MEKISGDSQEELERAQQAFTNLHAAMLNVVEVFSHDASLATSVADLLKSDGPVTAVVADFDVDGARKRLTAVLDDFELRRRNARVALWRVMIGEGCSIGEVSRVFGLSRQLVSRQLHEAS